MRRRETNSYFSFPPTHPGQYCVHFHVHPICSGLNISKVTSATLCFVEVIAVLALLVQSIQCILIPLVIVQGAVGHGVGHDAELAEEDLPEEQIDPRVKDLVERGQADRRQEEIAV